MITLGLYIRLEAKPGKEALVEALLRGGLAMVKAESKTRAWFAMRFDALTFGVFDVFNDAAALQAHLDGELAKLLFSQAEDLLAVPPVVAELEILAAKI